MNRRVAVITASQLALVGCVVVMMVWTRTSWLATLSVGVIGFAGITCARAIGSSPRHACLVAAWMATVTVPIWLLLPHGTPFTLDNSQAAMAWMIAAAILPNCGSGNERITAWRLLVITWGFIGWAIWLVEAYLQNKVGAFYVGLSIGMALIVVCKFWFRMPTPMIIASNTTILLLIGIPVADLLVSPRYRLTTHPDANKKYYSYSIAKMDPPTFARWWDYYREQYDLMAGRLYKHEVGDVVPYRFAPNSRSPLFDSMVSINSKGFRGREIPEEKGNAYRIVTLGESTTFGMTMGREDRPWPEVLEGMIQDRLKPARPVQVINAGVPAYTILDNLHRLGKDILPLKPDMIISYHGMNGFNLINPTLSRVRGALPPYRKRPLRILAKCEYRLAIMVFKRQRASAPAKQQQPFMDPLQTEYAEAYRQLIRCAQTNGISLVLANFSMAVNSRSEPDVVEFYRLAFPSVVSQIQANAIHSQIVKELAAQNAGVLFVDTRTDLDGEHEKFMDVIHFTQEGRNQLAENIFAGIRKQVERELGGPVTSKSD